MSRHDYPRAPGDFFSNRARGNIKSFRFDIRNHGDKLKGTDKLCKCAERIGRNNNLTSRLKIKGPKEHAHSGPARAYGKGILHADKIGKFFFKNSNALPVIFFKEPENSTQIFSAKHMYLSSGNHKSNLRNFIWYRLGNRTLLLA